MTDTTHADLIARAELLVKKARFAASMLRHSGTPPPPLEIATRFDEVAVLIEELVAALKAEASTTEHFQEGYHIHRLRTDNLEAGKKLLAVRLEAAENALEAAGDCICDDPTHRAFCQNYRRRLEAWRNLREEAS